MGQVEVGNQEIKEKAIAILNRFIMAEYDLTYTIASYLDRHLVFPLLEFLDLKKDIYNEDDLLKAKLDLLEKTNMVDFAMDIYKKLYKVDDVPQGIALNLNFKTLIANESRGTCFNNYCCLLILVIMFINCFRNERKKRISCCQVEGITN